MKTVSVPWAMWYESKKFDLTFPDSWDLTVANMKGGPDIGDAGIRRAFAESIGAPRLRDFAKGRRDAAILIDDLTRPTPSYRVLPYILEELAAAGLGDDKVRIVCAVASHRPMIRPDFIKKIGLDLLERLEVINHNAMDNLEFYGHTSQGIPIWINREFARSDLKIAAGMITPRGSFFGGGAKLLVPGVCGRETIYLNHTYCPDEIFRDHIAEIGRMVGLSYIVNPLLNPDGGIMGMVTGDPDKAFEAGVALGRVLYKTEVPEGMDIVVCNSWPKDTEATQAGMGRVPLYGSRHKAIRDGGALVLTSACPEGLGFHSVMGPGTLFRLRGQARSARHANVGPQAREILFSPNLNHYDVRAQFGEQMIFFKTWAEVIADLEREYGAKAKVCVFPCGAMTHGGN
jgi:lactate racemase